MTVSRSGFDPEGWRLPIKLDTASNGEFMPRPLSPAARLAKCLAHEHATRLARKLGLSRRGFLKSLCGAASTLLAMNEAFARLGFTGGGFSLPVDAACDLELAEASIGGKEFIFDAQCHHVEPTGPWRRLDNRWTYILRFFPQARCGDGAIECFSAEHLLREVFLDSDTDMAVLSAVPAALGASPAAVRCRFSQPCPRAQNRVRSYSEQVAGDAMTRPSRRACARRRSTVLTGSNG